MKYAIGIDIGGTRLKSGAVSADGRVLASAVLPTRQERGPEHLVDRICEYVEQARQKLRGRPDGIGLGMSGAVDPNRGSVLLPGKFNGLEDFPIVKRLSRRTKLPVVAENDARAAMIAEHRFGLARGRQWVVMITIGTGLGSGVVLEGRILRDPHLQFGTQLGFFILQSNQGRLCLSGARGTAEMFCSATALVHAVRDGLGRGIPSALSKAFWADPQSIDLPRIVAAAKKKDRLCIDEMRVWISNLGWLLVSAVHAYAPELIIIGGGGAPAARLWLKPLRQHVNRHLFRYPRGESIPIVISRLGDQAGVLGAAAAVWENRA